VDNLSGKLRKRLIACGFVALHRETTSPIIMSSQGGPVRYQADRAKRFRSFRICCGRQC
jgi:hypothetical protein